MKKKIQVILKKDYLNIGKKGKIINLATGYALNYLIPNNIVEIATPGNIKHILMFQEIKNKNTKIHQLTAKNLQESLQEIYKIQIKRKIGNNNNIFGSINEKDIINKIFNDTKIKIDKKQVEIPNIKKIGIFNIKINILNEISSIIKLYVLPDNI